MTSDKPLKYVETEVYFDIVWQNDQANYSYSTYHLSYPFMDASDEDCFSGKMVDVCISFDANLALVHSLCKVFVVICKIET